MGQIRFTSKNPYQDRFPNIRVISRETLELMKILRSNGYEVVVEPENGDTLCLLKQSDLQEFLSNPVNALLIGIPISIIVGILTNWLYDRFGRVPNSGEVHILLEVDENSRKIRYDHKGHEISDERFQVLTKQINSNYNFARPFPTMMSNGHPLIPIFLEHTTRVVGWAEEIVRDEKGLRIEGGRITDDETLDRINEGELKGWSVGGLINKGTCGICGQDYVQCLHIAGKEYDGKECDVRIDTFSLAEISLVKDPAQPLAKIEFR